jgi:hypothetical protein
LPVYGRPCGHLEHAGSCLVVWLGGGGAVLFVLSDVRPVMGQVVVFM